MLPDRLPLTFVFVTSLAACVGAEPERPNRMGGDDGGVAATLPEPPGRDAGLEPPDATVAQDGGVSTGFTDGGLPDSAPPAFDVRALTGLRLWFESTQGLVAERGGSGFRSWTDSSGAAGGPHTASAMEVNPPTIVMNGIGGRPSLAFTEGNGYLQLPRSERFQLDTGDFFFAVVATVNSGAGAFWTFRPNATAGSQQLFSPDGFCWAFGLGVTTGCTSTTAAPDARPHVFAVRRVASLIEFLVDGVTRGRRDLAGEAGNIRISEFAQDKVFIGGKVTMQLSELVLAVGPTSDASFRDLTEHLRVKYALR